MKIYNYHRDTGEFINESIANESPLEPGVYLIPANATQIKPPTVSANEAAVFVDGWQVVPDFRGQIAYDTETRVASQISDLGNVPAGKTLIAPPEYPAKWEGGSWVADLVAAEIQTKQRMTQFVQSILDSEALKHNYDNIVSATSYAGYANQFQAEGVAFGVWRSAVWAKCYEIMADVLQGERQVPTESELLAELPKLTL